MFNKSRWPKKSPLAVTKGKLNTPLKKIVDIEIIEEGMLDSKQF